MIIILRHVLFSTPACRLDWATDEGKKLIKKDENVNKKEKLKQKRKWLGCSLVNHLKISVGVGVCSSDNMNLTSWNSNIFPRMHSGFVVFLRNRDGSGHHSAIIQRLITLSAPPSPPHSPSLSRLSLFRPAHLSLSWEVICTGPHTHTHTHTHTHGHMMWNALSYFSSSLTQTSVRLSRSSHSSR